MTRTYFDLCIPTLQYTTIEIIFLNVNDINFGANGLSTWNTAEKLSIDTIRAILIAQD